MLTFGLLCYVFYSGYMYTNTYYKHEHIKGVVVELSDNRPGIGSTTQSIISTDEQEIAEVIRLLHERTVIKLFPDIGPVKVYTKDYFDVRIEFISDTDLTLEYRIDSLGHVEVKKGFGNKASNTMILGGSSKQWFNEAKDLFEDKKQNSLWSYRKQE
ncbi:hypothetical protein [Paenibacillus terreus]|uniref:hypothetical protein n=1 Tax=Paenibacillus terreus TaxID=1387834 RepID=UPI0035CD0299